MPIVETDSWREQYFAGVACPDDVHIPTDDADAYRLFPEHRWLYNKLLVAETQGLTCGPHGIVPPSFPVFSKPIYNLRGMGMETRTFRDEEEYLRGRDPGHMWMPLLEGEHLSSDVAVLDGEPRWWRHTIGTPLADAMFDHWTIDAAPRPALEAYGGEWFRRNLRGYTGMANVESIGGRLIEAHLRFADQWPDLYGPGWIDAVVELYAHRRWSYPDRDRRTGYSVVLFGAHGPRYHHPPAALVEDVLRGPEISSVQITFHEERAPELHAMPPGGFRLAIVNCWDLEVGRAARERLALHFFSTHTLRPTSRRRERRHARR